MALKNWQKLVSSARRAPEEAIKTFMTDIVSVEPRPMGDYTSGGERFVRLRQNQVVMENHEVHGAKATGPFVARDTFVCVSISMNTG